MKRTFVSAVVLATLLVVWPAEAAGPVTIQASPNPAYVGARVGFFGSSVWVRVL